MTSPLATYGSVGLPTVKQLLGIDISEESSAADCIAQASDLGSSMVADMLTCRPISSAAMVLVASTTILCYTASEVVSYSGIDAQTSDATTAVLDGQPNDGRSVAGCYQISQTRKLTSGWLV